MPEFKRDPSDYEITATAKRILNTNHVDSDACYAKSHGFVLSCEGVVRMIGGDAQSVTPVIMEKVDLQFRAIYGVKSVRWRLDNFIKLDGTWKVVLLDDRRYKKMMTIETATLKAMKIKDLRSELAKRIEDRKKRMFNG